MGRLSKLWSRHKSKSPSGTDALPSRPSSTEPTRAALLTPGALPTRPASTGPTNGLASAGVHGSPSTTTSPPPHVTQSSHSRPPSVSPTLSSPTPDNAKSSSTSAPNSALAKAIAKHVTSLSENEKAAFLNSELTEHNLFQKVREYDDDHAETSQLRKAASKLETSLEMLKKFSNIISVATSGSPEATIIISAVRVVFDIALGFLAFFSKLTGMLSRLSDFVEPLTVYSSIPEHHTSLHNAVIGVYGDILLFCQKAHAVFIDDRGCRRKMPAFRVMWRTQWLPFESEFGVIENDMQHHLRALQHSAAALTAATALDIQSMQRIQLKEDLLNWLSDFRYEERHEKRFAQIHPGTADWLLDTDEFLDWFESVDSSVIWCYGGPGVGKSFLAANVLEYITSTRALDPDVGVAFVYYDHQVATQQDLDHVVRALLKQLVRVSNTLPDHLVLAKQKSLPIGSVEDFLVVAEAFSEIFIVVDALDECVSSNRPGMLGFLREITKRLPLAKIYVTSRPEIDISRDMEVGGTPTLKIDISLTAPDIEKYVSDEVHDLRRGRNGVQLCVRSDELADDIIHTLTAKAYGMFLWVKLQLENLCRVSESRRDSAIRAALESLPEGLENTYERIAEQIEAKPEYLRSLAVRCLQWVFYAQRPLFVEELRFALATFSPGENAVDIELDDFEVIFGACAHLIVLEPVYYISGLSIVRPAHYSVQEYFMTHRLASSPTITSRLLDEKKVHADLAAVCLTHLKQPMMRSGEFEITERSLYLTQDPFLQYAAGYFDIHTTLGVDMLEHPISDFLDSDPVLLRSVLCTRAMLDVPWLQCYVRSDPYGVAFAWVEYKNAATHSNWGAAVMVEVTYLGTLPEIQEQYGSREGASHALNYACRVKNHLRLVELLDSGIDPNPPDPWGGSILHVAVRVQHEMVIETLIERGADVNARDYRGTTVLQFAAMLASPKIVQQLLDKGADVHAQGGPWGNALNAAASRADLPGVSTVVSTEITELLIKNGADVNARAGPCGTALVAAAVGGKTGAVELLLEAGADVHVEDASILPSRMPSDDPVFQNEALDAPGPVLDSPLYLACLNGHVHTVEALLNHGADPNREEGAYGNAMFATLEHGDNNKIVALLIHAGFQVDVDTLATAASRGRIDSLIEILSADHEGSLFSDIDIGVALVAAWRTEWWPVPVHSPSRKLVIKRLKTQMRLNNDLGPDDAIDDAVGHFFEEVDDEDWETAESGSEVSMRSDECVVMV